MKREIFESLKNELQNGKTMDLSFETDETVYIRRWIPRERLIILGGGHIAKPLCQAGALLGFSVVVVDDRPSFANALRFPEAETVICGGFGETIDSLKIRETDFVCTVTRGHRHDGDCLRHILPGTMPKYLGMIGSRRRVAGLKEALKEEGYDPERLDSICAPIGLPIGAQTPEEIAVSIAAQLVEYRRAGNGAGSPENCLLQTNVDMALLEALSDNREPLVMALVVETKGSTPVKSGAMMAVGALGRVQGTVGGGCGESEITQIARKMVGKQEKTCISVDMTNEVAEEEGMVCGGTMKVLLESVE